MTKVMKDLCRKCKTAAHLILKVIVRLTAVLFLCDSIKTKYTNSDTELKPFLHLVCFGPSIRHHCRLKDSTHTQKKRLKTSMQLKC